MVVKFEYHGVNWFVIVQFILKEVVLLKFNSSMLLTIYLVFPTVFPYVYKKELSKLQHFSFFQLFIPQNKIHTFFIDEACINSLRTFIYM